MNDKRTNDEISNSIVGAKKTAQQAQIPAEHAAIFDSIAGAVKTPRPTTQLTSIPKEHAAIFDSIAASAPAQVPALADTTEQEPSSGLMGTVGKNLDIGFKNLQNSAVGLALIYGQIDPETAADYISTNQLEANEAYHGLSERARSQIENIEAAEGFFPTIGAAVTNPVGAAQLSLQSVPYSIPATVLGGAGALAGARAGSAIPIPHAGAKAVAAGLGALGGGIGSFVGGAPIEIGAWIDQALQDRGADLSTREGRLAAYSNPEMMREVRAEAERKGLTHATVDSLWNLMSGRLLAGTVGRSLPSRIKAGAADTGIQMAGEMGSEFAGQLAAYEGDISKIDSGDIALEGVLSVPQSVAQTGIGAAIRQDIDAIPETPSRPQPVSTRDRLADAMEAPGDVAPAVPAAEGATDGSLPSDVIPTAAEVLPPISEPDAPSRDDLAAAMQPPEASEEQQAVEPAAEEKPLTFAQQLPLMTEEQLLAHYNGKNVRNRNLAKRELEARFPDSDITKAIDIEVAATQANPDPTDAQKEAGNYQKGHVSINGMDISIENAKGSMRRGKDAAGNEWQVQMPAHYGYIRRTEGADGDHVDVYIGDNHQSDKVFVVDQINADDGSFDEHKAMIGFDNIQSAVDAFDKAFSDGRAEHRLGEITVMTTQEFKDWLKNGDTKKPLLYKPRTEPEVTVESLKKSLEVLRENARRTGWDLFKINMRNDLEAQIAALEQPQVDAELTQVTPELAQVAPEPEAQVVESAPQEQTVSGPRKGEVGMMLSAGEVVLTSTGRETSPFPKFQTKTGKTTKRHINDVDNWLIQNAIDEAKSRGDDYNATLFEGALNNPQQADKDSAEAYLFDPDFIFELPPSVLKPLVDATETTNTPPAQPEQNVEANQATGEQNATPAQPEIRISDVSINDSRGGENFGYKELKVDGTPQAAADINIYGDEVSIRNIVTRPDQRRKGYAKMLVDDLFREFPDKKIFITSTTEDGSAFFSANYDVMEDGQIFPKGTSAATVEDSSTVEVTEQQAPETPLENQEVNANETEVTESEPAQPEQSPEERGAENAGAAQETGAERTETAPGRKEKMRDVGEKMEGKRAFQENMRGKNMPEQAKQIIEQTRKKNTFNTAKREGQTDGAARFGAEIVAEFKDFSAYLYDRNILKKSGSRRYKEKMPGWEEQVKIIFSETGDGTVDVMDNGRYKIGFWRFTPEQIAEYRNRIITHAEQYVELGSRLNDILDNSKNIEELKVELKNALEDAEFEDVFDRFAKQWNLKRDIFSPTSWSVFGRITDETGEKKKNRVEKTLTRPKLETISREGMKDYRNSRDITADEFMNTFGFRGVEFGEWVNAREGQLHVNNAYDALSDLAHRLGIAKSDISLGGKLGFAFGSRGSGEHAAHYEPETNVINLTKTKGDGSVAHEWLHALDYNLRANGRDSAAKMDALYKGLEQTLDAGRVEKYVRDFLAGKIFYQRNKSAGVLGNAKMFIGFLERDPYRQIGKYTDFKRQADLLGKNYWGTGRELLARAWEAFIIDTLDGKSPYLVSDWASEGVVTKEAGYRGTPYPTGQERQDFNAAFEDFLKAIEFSSNGVKFKDGAVLLVEKNVEAVKEEARQLLPKLADMMEEVSNANVQQDSVPASTSEGDGGASTEDVSGYATDEDIEHLFGRDRQRSGADVSEESGISGEESRDGGSRSEADSERNSVRRDDTVPERVEGEKPDYQAEGVNHKIAVGALDEKRGQKEKARDNIKAIKLVKELERDNRPATPEEQLLLAKFTGWGSIKNAFPGLDGKPKDGWADIVDEVKDILDEKEYREARRSIQFAHYTSEIVTRGMWAALERFGLKSGSIFEPGMGIGNFAGTIPDSMSLQYSGIEIDPMTARIARILYPESSVRNVDFTSARYADGMFDAAIGNPPFSDSKVKSDPKYRKENLSLHNYFFVKTLDMLAPGGVMGFVTSRYSLDAINEEARKKMAETADLVGAIRLPNTAFKTNAHTEVVTDIIFLRKRLPGEESNGVQWIESKPIDLVDENGKPHHINEYFLNNPEMVLGDFSSAGTMYSKGSLTVDPVASHDLKQQIEEAVNRLPENIVTEIRKANTAALDMQPVEQKEGSYYIKDDVLMRVEDGIGVPVPLRGKEAGGLPKGDVDKIRALIPVRDALRDAMTAMVARDDAAMKEAQSVLDKAYGAFVKKYGPITKSETETRKPTASQYEDARNELRDDYLAADEEFDEGDIDLTGLLNRINPETGKKYTTAQIAKIRREKREAIEAAGGVVNEGDFDPSVVPDNVSIKYPNLDPFKADPEYYNLMILENYDEETGKATKTDVFNKNIVAEVKRPEINTAVDALNYSLFVKNGVDPEFMAQELGRNAESIVEELEQLDLIYALPNPEGGEIYKYSEEYLSGEVKKKLAYAKRIAELDSRYERNVRALEAVQPADIPASDINTQLGSPYFSAEIITDFMKSELGIPARVNYARSINIWSVEALDPRAPENTQQYGTDKRPAADLMEALLMRRDIKVTSKDPEGKQIVDVASTQAAQDKAKELQEKFSEWIWKSSHAETVHRKYNDDFNNLVPRKFDGSHITAAISPSIKLRQHQKNVIWRILQSGNTYIAHAVGAGKTLEMVSAGMEMRRMGYWRKPLYVVPNHMLAQFSGEFKAAYPQAKIMVADEDQFHTDRRKRFVANVAKSDLDAVIMTFSSFKKIPVSKEFEAQMIETEIGKYRAAITEMKSSKSGGFGSTVARIEKQVQKLEERLKGLRSKDTDQSFSFEELGIDAILADEAHNFRKLSFPTAQGSMKGVNPIGSKASWDLYTKAKYLDSIHPGRSLVLASGTPLTNTLAEVFTIQRYMDERSLVERGIDSFDAWSSVYAATVTNPERQPSGAYKTVTRLAEFRNLQSLSQMVREFMDTVTSDELGALVDRPVMKSGAMIIKTTKPSREYMAFQKYLGHRTELVAKSSNRNQKGADNILAIINEGRHAAIDMRLIDPTLPETESKLEDMIENVFTIWKQTSGDVFKNRYRGDDKKSPITGGTQLIFSDLGIKPKTKNGKTFSAYDHIKRKLVASGVPANQIAFIADYDTTEEKRRLQAAVNAGEIRILIGSTAKMGTGLNVQNRLKAVHNLDAPWLPADLEQRVGRALRQGNQYGEIEVYGYGTEGSYDSTMWGMLETKAKAIIQFLKGDTDLTSMRDIEETDHYRIAKAMTSGDPRVLQQAQLQSEVEKLARQASNFRNEQVQIKSSIAQKKSDTDHQKDQIALIEEALKKRRDLPENGFLMTVMGKPYTERAEASDALTKAVNDATLMNTGTGGSGIKIGEFRGFDVNLFVGVNSNLKISYEIFLNDPALINHGKDWESGGSPFSGSGAITTLNNALNRMEKRLENAGTSIERNTREIKVLESNIKDKFPKEAELSEKRDELTKIETDLRENAPVEVVYDDYPIEYWAMNKAAVNGTAFSIVSDEDYHYDAARSEKGADEKNRLVASINRHLKKIGFPAANVQIMDQFSAQDGFDSRAIGAFKDGIIYLSMVADDVKSVLNHELIHALRAAGAFTDAEWKMLVARAPEWRQKYGIDKTYRHLDLSEDQLNEEAVAAAFQDYSIQGPVRRIFNRILRFLNGIREYLMDTKGYKSAEEVFEAILGGDFAVASDFSNVTPQIMYAKGYDSETIEVDGVVRPTTNSSGNPISDTKEGLEAFWRWFGDSKVVDADGKPLVVYHGSPSVEIQSFNEDSLTYFSSSPSVSNQYAGASVWASKSVKGAVYPVYLSIKDPLEIDAAKSSYNNLRVDWQPFKPVVYGRLPKNAVSVEDAAIKAKADGKDGLIVKDVKDNKLQGYDYVSDVFVTLASTQIKSVHNRGTFDANDSKILYALPTKKAEALKDATDFLDTVKGMDGTLRQSLGKVSALILHPHQIASLYEKFTPVYREVIKMMKARDIMVHDLTQHINIYNKLDRATKKKVDAVLELGRLTKTNFDVDDSGRIEVKNHGLSGLRHSKPGETIVLEDVAVEAYVGVRTAMNEALDLYIETIIEEYGFDAEIKNSADLEAAIKKEDDEKARAKMNEALEIILGIEAAKREGYVPLKRWGEVGIIVRPKMEDEDGNRNPVWFERVELPRGPLRKKILGENKSVREAVTALSEQFSSDDYEIEVFEVKDFSKLQTKLTLNELDVLAASSDMAREDYDAMREMIADAIKKRGFRSHFFKAKDTLGYSADFERAINDYVVSISGHLANRKHKPKLENAIGAIEKSGQASLFDYARKYVTYISDPVEEFGALRQMGFMWYLAGNVASGITNLSQPIMVTAPWFKGMFKHQDIARTMSVAYKEVVSMMTTSKGTDAFDLDKAPDDVRAALKWANREGMFLPLNTFDAMAIANTSLSYLRGLDRQMRDIQDVVSLTFSVPERANRIVTYIAAYRFAKDPANHKAIMSFVGRDQIGRQELAGKTGEDFARAFGEYAVFSTQFRMGKTNRPTLSRGAGTLPFQFMSFVMQAFELMYRLGKLHGNKNGAALGMMIFAIIAMSGIKGFPLEDDIQRMIEAAWKAVKRTDLDIDSEMRKILSEAVGPELAEVVLKGIPATYLNVDMSGRLGYGNIMPDSQADMLGIWYDMIVERPLKAMTSIAREDYVQAAADVAPAILRNIIQAYAWSEEGIKSGRTGKTVIIREDLTDYDIGLRALGFTSGSISRERALIYAEQRANRAADDLRNDYYDILTRAIVARNQLYSSDPEASRRYQAKIDATMLAIQQHNAKSPPHKQVNINPRTLKERVKRQMHGASGQRDRKQARSETGLLRKAYGRED